MKMTGLYIMGESSGCVDGSDIYTFYSRLYATLAYIENKNVYKNVCG